MLTGQIRLIRVVIRLILSNIVIGASPTEKMPTDRDLRLSNPTRKPESAAPTVLDVGAQCFRRLHAETAPGWSPCSH